MRLVLAGSWIVFSSAPIAHAQFSARLPNSASVSVTTPGGSAGGSGGFLMGADDCNAAHTLLAPGTQLGVPFTTGTTGAQGQSEGNCFAQGTTGITNDVWFDWRATVTGWALLETCTTQSLDTKIAVYPLSAGSCPADGSSLACDDDDCAIRARVQWWVTEGTSYTLQIGTTPGAPGGSGVFDLHEFPYTVCGQLDDGTTENSLGLTAGGETGWLHSIIGCFYECESIETAYGTTAGGGGQVPNGSAARLAVYNDSDCDENPTTGLELRGSLATFVTNSDTDLLNSHPVTGSIDASNCAWILATAVHAVGQFPAPMDETNPSPEAWIVGQTTGAGGVLDIDDLNANNVPPLQMQAIGFPASFLLRARGDGEGVFYPHECVGTACPCGNDTNDGWSGCDNSLPGSKGATLGGGGFAELSDDDFGLFVHDTPNQPGMFFQGRTFLAPIAFGDGLRCCADDIVRCGTWLPSGNQTNTSTGNHIGGNTPPISQIGPNVNLVPGDVRCYQWWYRDVANGPCGTGFNLSNSIRVTWRP